MERSFFLGKSSFALFVWLVVAVTIALNIGAVNRYYKTTATSISEINDTVTEFIFSSVPAAVQQTLPHFNSKPVAIAKSDLQCMAENIYYEAGNQSYVGKIAVGQVVLNRLKTQGYPDSVCGVIFDGSKNVKTSACQFSWTCAPHKAINTASDMWQQSLEVAKELLDKKIRVDVTEGATSYHADYVKPSWSKTLVKVTQIDQHIFYKK